MQKSDVTIDRFVSLVHSAAYDSVSPRCVVKYQLEGPMNRFFYRTALVLIVLLPGYAFSQSANATVSGTVSDATGADSGSDSHSNEHADRRRYHRIQ